MNQYTLARALNRRGLTGTAGLVIATMISIVIIVAVATPVTQSLINNVTCAGNTNLSQCQPSASGATRTIIELVPVFFGLAALVTVAALFS